MPFVWLIGAPGMLFVPILSFLVLCVLALKFAQKYNSHIFALFLVFSISLSPTISRWMISNVTDSLVSVLFAITAYIISLRLARWREITLIVFLVVCSSITRFCLPIWLAIAIVWFVNRRRNDGVLLAAFSSLLSIPTFLYAPDNALLPGSNPVTIWEKISGLGISFIRVGFYEVAELAALDRVLLALLLIAIIASFRFLKMVESQYFLSVLLSVWAIGAINGTVGVNFRYQMPVLGFMFWVLSVNFPKFRDGMLGNRLNIVSSKAQY
jgi:hypothetical protein